MNITSNFNFIRTTLLLFSFLCLWHLVHYIPTSNEISKFIDAMPLINPEWVPSLSGVQNLFVSRQKLFQLMMSPLLGQGDFLFAALVGRALGFLTLAIAFTKLGEALQLGTALTLLAVAVFVRFQSLAAGEWIVLSIEPKVFSYALALYVLAHLMSRSGSALILAFLMGLAVSFHPLVGAYMTLFIVGMLLVEQRFHQNTLNKVFQIILLYSLGAAFALRPIFSYAINFFNQATGTTSGESTSTIYVYMRTPHHLDPWSWAPAWWYMSCLSLMLIAVSLFLVLRVFEAGVNPALRQAVLSLTYFATCTLIPFILGWAIRPFDTEGVLLQFYLFRSADVIIPLTSFFLCAVVLRLFLREQQVYLRFLPRIAVVVVFLLLVPSFVKDVRALAYFPAGHKFVSAHWLKLCQWVEKNTEEEALFITNPGDSMTFPWLARRRMYGTFKQVPLSGGLHEWKKRMMLLGDLQEPLKKSGFELGREISLRYRKHSDVYVKGLLHETGAKYFVTTASHDLDLPLVYENKAFRIYSLGKK